MAGVEKDETLSDQELAEWLAARTGAPLEEVERGLDEGTRRREFIIDELIEAGMTGAELLDAVVHLTGLDERGARVLIAAREGKDPA
jgi:hypothetical protein